MRPIDADALTWLVEEYKLAISPITEEQERDNRLPLQMLTEFENMIAEQPTIDAVPVVRCIQAALPFEYGKVYPICGWNNGVHIIGVSEQGDPVDLVCHNYGDELWDAEKTDGIECLGARFVYCADGERKDGETEHGNTYSLGKIEMPNGAMKQIIADGERKDGEQ